MNASEIVSMLESEGFRLSASGGSILVNPSSKLTSSNRALLRDHKMEILALLRASLSFKPVRPSLESLVRSVGVAWAFTPAEMDEALMHALAKPDETRRCFEALAAEIKPRSDLWDDRTTCKSCANRRYDGVCLAAVRQEFPAARGYTPDPDMRRRCEGFAPRLADSDQRPGSERWPGLIRQRGE